MTIVHNPRVGELLRPDYRPADINRLRAFLVRAGTFRYPRLHNGLFPAASVDPRTQYTGYARVWVRDNVQVAHAAHLLGRRAWAVRNLTTLAAFFRTQARRFEAIIEGRADPRDPRQRPAIRFDGRTLRVPRARWPHAQNDALGYFLWKYCRLIGEGAIPPRSIDWEVIARFPRYFRAIRYWRDEDSGHWEEQPKISASSIGVVVAALEELRALKARVPVVDETDLDDLIARGRSALAAILPWECRQKDPAKRRRYDSALLFLIWPLAVVDEQMADLILADVGGHLQGEHGVRRYLGDSFWCADYKRKVRASRRTSDWSDDVAARNRLVKPGDEAQWCLFDPVLSIIFGLRHRREGTADLRARQVHHLNRALGHLTGPDSGFPELRCPELCYREGNVWQPSDATPLLWSQALLEVALQEMGRPRR